MLKKKDKPSKDNPAICLCNQVTKKTVQEAIARGCKTLSALGDATTAGYGQCGGSCRPNLQAMIDDYKANKSFSKNSKK